jgi:hypothetical protein
MTVIIPAKFKHILIGLFVSYAFLALSAFANDQDDFFTAIQFNHVSSLPSMLARGVNPNAKEPVRGETALILAVRENADNAFDFLLSVKGIDLNAQANNGNTALMMSAYLENFHAVNALLELGAEVNKTGWTALHYAAISGNDAIISALLEHAAYIDAQTPTGLTALMLALRENKTSAVKLLLTEGADPTIKNNQQETALVMAKKLEFRGMVELIQNGVAQFQQRQRAP